ncbi:MAG: hypothetical protein U0556_02425 [Dehalococcoidia bacterium]
MVAAIVGVTFVFAFGVNACAHLVLLLRHDRLVQTHRGTLEFASAWIGDGLLLPAMNVAGWKVVQGTGRPARAEIVAAVVAAGATTAAMHIGQALGGLVNWSMPRPWRWNWLGWYHLAFMWTQLTFLTLVLVRAVRRPAMVWQPAALVVGGLAIFALLLRWDYRAA